MQSSSVLQDVQIFGMPVSKNDTSTKLLLFTWISSALRQLQNYLTTKEYKIIEGLFIHQYNNHLTESEVQGIQSIVSHTNVTSLQLDEVKKGVNALVKRGLFHNGHLEFINYFLEEQNYYQLPQEYFQFKENLINQLYATYANTQTEDHQQQFQDFQIPIKSEDGELGIELNAKIYNSSEDQAKEGDKALKTIRIYDKSTVTGILTNQDIRTLEHLLNGTIEIKGVSLERIISSVKLFLQAVKEKYSKKKKGLGSKKGMDAIEIPYLPRLFNLNKIQLFATEVTADIRLLQKELARIIKKELPRNYSVYYINNILETEKINNFINQMKLMKDTKNLNKLAPVIVYFRLHDGIDAVDGFTSSSILTQDEQFGVTVSHNMEWALKSSGIPLWGNNGPQEILVGLGLLGNCLEVARASHLEQQYAPVNGYHSKLLMDGALTLFYPDVHLLPFLQITVGNSLLPPPEFFRNKQNRKKLEFTVVKQEDDKKWAVHPLNFVKLPGVPDKYFLKVDEHHRSNTSVYYQTEKYYVHPIFVIDKSKSMGKSFTQLVLPACEDIHRNLQPNSASAVFFGRTVNQFAIKTSDFFHSEQVKSIELEGATNIIEAYEKAVDIALSKRNKLVAKKKMQPENILFMILLLSDGKDTTNSNHRIESSLKTYFHNVSGNQLNVIFKLVNIGTKCDTSLLMRIKQNCESVIVSEELPVYYAKTRASISEVANKLSSDLLEIVKNRSATHLKLASCEDWNGFIVSFFKLPKKECLVILDNEDGGILYKGIPPREMYVNGHYITRIFYNEASIGDNIAILGIITRLILDIKVAAVSGRDTTEVMKELEAMIQGFCSLNFSVSSLTGSTPVERIALMKKSSQLINDLKYLFNELTYSIALVKTKMDADQQTVWLNKIEDMKFGKKALQRNQKSNQEISSDEIVNDLLQLVENVKNHFIAENPSKECRELNYSAAQLELNEKYDNRTSVLSGMTALDHLKQIYTAFSNSNELKQVGINDLLYSFGMLGVFIRVRRTDSSQVNPWTIVVEYVSIDRGDTCSWMCILDANIDYKDPSRSQPVSDILIVENPLHSYPYKEFQRTKLNLAYTSVVFTRNPCLSIPSQSISLLMISFVKSIEQLMNPSFRNEKLLELTFEMYFSIRKKISQKDYWVNIVKKLYLPNPGKYMTESEEDDIISIAKILVPLCCLDQCGDLFTSSDLFRQLASSSLCLLAEAVSRSCRVLAKIRDQFRNARPLIRKALGIHEWEIETPNVQLILEKSTPTPSFSREYSQVRGKKQSSKLFANTSWTNTSPQAVVACVGFASILHNFPQKEKLTPEYLHANRQSIFTHFLTELKAITMRNFIVKYFPDVPPLDLQIALYVQGLCYHTSQERRQPIPSLENPVAVLQDIAENERKTIYEEKVAAAFKHLRNQNAMVNRQIKLAEKMREQEEFLRLHSLPQLFTHGTVAQLNFNRPKNDQLELLNSGLLRHHCCFPMCPQYLHNFATASDLKSGTRHGLFKHLKFAFGPRVRYIPNFHNVAKSYKKTYTTKSEFVAKMLVFCNATKVKNKVPNWDEYYTTLINLCWESIQ